VQPIYQATEYRGVRVILPDADTSPRLGRQMARKFVLGSVLIVLFSAIAVASAILIELHSDLANLFPDKSDTAFGNGAFDDVPAGDPQTILLLGSDRRFADIKAKIRPRSDTIIVVRLDPDKKATAVMSIPRDLKVAVPGHGTRKINEAYELGGAELTVRTVRKLLGIEINHGVNVNFGGFTRAVNRLGCVYADIDRRYYNDNSGAGPNYATIDLKPGYQKLCGQDALDYVRFRHEDSDFVRAARQQEFLRQAKEQIGLGKLFGDRRELLRIFGRYTDTDIARKNDAEVFGLMKLAYESSKSPITQIPFPATDSADHSFVRISRKSLRATVAKFIAVRGGERPIGSGSASGGGGGKRRPKRLKSSTRLAPGLVAAKAEGEDHVLTMELRLEPLGLPVLFPRVRLARGGYVRDSPRSYEIFDRNKNRYRAYRIVLWSGVNGQYYGVQGTTWKAPPILDNPTDGRRIGNRTYRRYFDGSKLRLIAWETPKAWYWVSNSLTQQLTNQQMMDIARSTQRFGS
jgi:LCP family protein required for cell wall assembly